MSDTSSDESSSSDSGSVRTYRLFANKKKAKKLNKFFHMKHTQKQSGAAPVRDLKQLNALEALGVDTSKYLSQGRYTEYLANEKRKGIFRKLSQTIDPDSHDQKTGKLNLTTIPYPRLIDPMNVHSEIRDTYKTERFAEFKKLIKKIETERALFEPTNSLETTFLLASICRLAEAFRILSNLTQFSLCNLNKKAFKDKKYKTTFTQATIASMNAIMEELGEISIFLHPPALRRKSTNYQHNLLSRHRNRIETLPFVPNKNLLGKASNVLEDPQKYGMNLRYVRKKERLSAQKLLSLTRNNNRGFVRRGRFKNNRYNFRGNFRGQSRNRNRRGNYNNSYNNNYNNNYRGNNRRQPYYPKRGRGRGRGRGSNKGRNNNNQNATTQAPAKTQG